MKKIRNLFGKIKSYIEDTSILVDYKCIYFIAVYGVFSSLVFCALFSAIDFDKSIEYIMFAVIAVVITLAYLLYRYDELKKVKYFLVLILSLVFIPITYLLTGDIYNGAPLFFVSCIILTFFVIRERIVYFIALVEILWYTYLLYLPLAYPERFVECQNLSRPGEGIIMSFLGATFVPVFVISFQTNSYDKMHKELEESSKMIDEAQFNKSRFLANMTHEIRTPMNAIIGMNELILRENLDAESRELAEVIKTSSNQLLNIINNILEYSKLESQKLEFNLGKYDFRKLIAEIVETVSGEYANENSEFYVDIDPAIPYLLFGDALRIKQVFMYILFSAIHKLPHSRITLSIKGDVDDNTNSVMLSCVISESGMGLSSNEVEAMLSAYAQYDSRQKSDFKKLGMEFSICREILDMMGGNLSIESIENVGIAIRFDFINYIINDAAIAELSFGKDYNVLIYCEEEYVRDIWRDILAEYKIYPQFVEGPSAFRIAIENKRYTHIFIDDVFYPILKDTIKEAELDKNVFVITESGSIYSDFGECKILRKPLYCINVADALNDKWEEDKYKIAAKKEGVIFPQAKVLVVDDSVVNLRVIEGMLSTFKIKAKVCKSGKKALDILDREEFDLLILDQRMPELDGIDLLHLIKNLNNANAIIPAVCATADFGPDVEKMLISEGFSDYLAKPVRRHYLERMLRSFIPAELAVNISINEKDSNDKTQDKEAKEEKESINPQIIYFQQGIDNVGGSEEAFNEVLLAFYKEGIRKLELLPNMYEKDLPNYIIDVHALKSSCAAIGATGMSLLFKELEFAGRAANLEFIQGHNNHVCDEFSKLLVTINDYLAEKGIISKEPTTEVLKEQMELTSEAVAEVSDSLAKFNLKLCEDKLKELSQNNYGEEYNKLIKTAFDAYEQFDYHKVKEVLNSIKEQIG